jgi:serine/threonine-protein kinase HipA
VSSKRFTSECFVYITLPGQTQAVTAGRFVLTKDRRGGVQGRFAYGTHYLARSNAVAIDPFELKLSDETYETNRLGGVFGALRDAGPDYWGRYVIEKHAGKAQLSELDYLLESPDDRAGALGFGLGQLPPAPRRKFNKTLELAKLQKIADALIRDDLSELDEDAAQIQDLMLLGTSMGGARPKAVVEDDDGLWIAKFNRPDDRWNNTRVEHAMLQLARSCGLSVATSRIETVAGRDVLLVKRFDRDRTRAGYCRARMISGLTVLRADETPEARNNRWSYVLLAEELRRVVAEPKRDTFELFQRICFNALISNIDDHPRNHALIAKARAWTLSPAFDLTPSPVIAQDRRDLAMTVGDMGRFANARNIQSQSARFLLEPRQAAAVVSDMTGRVRSTWYDVVRSCGVSEQDAETIRRAFVYEGFLRE